MDTRERIESLVDLLMKGNLRPETSERIRAWFAETDNRDEKDAALEEAFYNLVSEEMPDSYAYGMFRRFSVMAGIEDVDTVEPRASKKGKTAKNFVYRRTWLAVAAVLLPLFVVAGYLTMRLVDRPVPVNMMEVAVLEGEEIPKLVELPDGSQVYMNSDSRIIYPETFANGRGVELDGEAYFVVESDPANPFSVKTDKLDVSVTGTEFNLHSFAGHDIAEIRLHSGQVSVKADDSEFSLDPLQQLVLNTATGEVAVEEFDPLDIDDWRTSEIFFDNVNLEKILRRIAKHYKMDIEIAPGSHTGETVRMVFDKKGDVDDALFVLRHAVRNKFNYRIEEGRIIVSGK